MEFIYGNNDGKIRPVSVDKNGAVFISETNYQLVKTVTLDLTTARDKEEIDVDFDSVSVAYPDNDVTIYIGNAVEDKKMVIKDSISIDVASDKLFISNEAKSGQAQIWFFAKGVAVNG